MSVNLENIFSEIFNTEIAQGEDKLRIAQVGNLRVFGTFLTETLQVKT